MHLSVYKIVVNARPSEMGMSFLTNCVWIDKKVAWWPAPRKIWFRVFPNENHIILIRNDFNFLFLFYANNHRYGIDIYDKNRFETQYKNSVKPLIIMEIIV